MVIYETGFVKCAIVRVINSHVPRAREGAAEIWASMIYWYLSTLSRTIFILQILLNIQKHGFVIEKVL